jgi:hypothetical protein
MAFLNDIAESKTAHEMLFRVLASEMGILGARPTSAESQFNAMVDACPTIRMNLLAKDWGDRSIAASDGLDRIKIDRAADAALFSRVFKAVTAMQKAGRDAESIVNEVVYPEIKKMVAAVPNLAAFLREASGELQNIEITPAAGRVP